MITQNFPAHWRVTVAVEREGAVDSRGNRGPSTFHDVGDCLVSGQSTEEEARRDLPDTEAYLYAPAGANFSHRDIVTIPEGEHLWPWGKYRVNGQPGFTPLGVRIQLKKV